MNLCLTASESNRDDSRGNFSSKETENEIKENQRAVLQSSEGGQGKIE